MLTEWILADLADAETRLRAQVLANVAAERRHERPGGGNSVNWATLHIARHAELAVAILGGGEPSSKGGFGVGEVEPERWPEPADADAIERYALATFTAGQRLLSTIDLGTLDEIPDAAITLERAAVPRDQFGWLYDQWAGQPRAFFIRWPLIAHQTNHIGEMIATRNRMGVSPYGG